MVLLSKAQQLWDMEDEEFEEVSVPEWKIDGETVTVRIRVLSGIERDKYEASCVRMHKGQQIADPVNARARLVAWTAVDGEGQKIFSGQEDVLKLGMKNSKAVNKLWEHACRLSGIDIDGSLSLEDDADFKDAPNEGSTSG